jgi:hypothetical protein
MRFLPALSLFFPLCAFIFSACSSDNSATENEEMTNVPFTRDVSIDTCLVIINESTDFCDWKKVFETMDDLRDKYGIEVVELFQGKQDTNLTLSINNISSLDEADNFVNSEKLKSAMGDVFFSDATKLHFLDQQLKYTLETNDTLTMYMTFKTLNYDRWEKAFLDDYRENPTRDFEVVRVFRGVEEPNHVHMIFKVNDPQYIEKSEKNNAFKMKMLAAGVVSYPVTYKLQGVKI